MDIVRNRYGDDAVKRAVTLGIKGMSYRNSPFSGQPLLTEKK
jgi:hypothetical protein